MPEREPIRLSKLMSERGICSRREADLYIEQGLVFVDDQADRLCLRATGAGFHPRHHADPPGKPLERR